LSAVLARSLGMTTSASSDASLWVVSGTRSLSTEVLFAVLGA
jgi:hypothetical protein